MARLNHAPWPLPSPLESVHCHSDRKPPEEARDYDYDHNLHLGNVACDLPADTGIRTELLADTEIRTEHRAAV